MQIPRVPYSLFIDQVNDGEVKSLHNARTNQIRIKRGGGRSSFSFATTPIFDMDLPQRLESKGVEFAAQL